MPEAQNRRLPTTHFVAEPAGSARAITDCGRSIPLFRYDLAFPRGGRQEAFQNASEESDFLQRMEAKFFQNAKQDMSTFARVYRPLLTCNCHGWILVEGRFGIEDSFIGTILEDNAYQTVEQVQVGDLGVHRVGKNIVHSSIVIGASETGTLKLRSKFGPFGVFDHSMDVYPFVRGCATIFYRSPRLGHAMPILEAG